MAPILESDDYSLLHMERISQYISLPPACLSNPLPAVCASILSPLLLSYYPPARGIVLAYEDVQLSDSPPISSEEKARLAKEKRKSKSRHRHEESDTEDEEDEADAKPKQLLLYIYNEYSAPFLWATATFLVWRPATGAWISARVSQQASTHLTLSHLNSFPISILRQHLPDGWTWTPNSSYSKGGGDEGWWTDEEGLPIEDVLRVRIRDFQGRMDGKGQERAGLKIDGSLVSGEVEAVRKAEGAEGMKKRREGRVKAKGAMKTRVPLPGEVVEVD